MTCIHLRLFPPHRREVIVLPCMILVILNGMLFKVFVGTILEQLLIVCFNPCYVSSDDVINSTYIQYFLAKVNKDMFRLHCFP